MFPEGFKWLWMVLVAVPGGSRRFLVVVDSSRWLWMAFVAVRDGSRWLW